MRFISSNFTVYPGSHHILEKYFRDQGGVVSMIQRERGTFKGIQAVQHGVKDEMPASGSRVCSLFPSYLVVQVTGKAGDIILAHYGLPHHIAPNTSPNIRFEQRSSISCR